MIDLFDGYEIITNEKETYGIIFLKPCLLEFSDKASLKQLIMQYIKEKHLDVHRVEAILRPLHIFSIRVNHN